ncbi:MAG: spore photoproduct lyase family protein [Pseudomonadota bacterium]
MSRFIPEKIFIEKAALALPLTQQILQRCPDSPCEEISEAKELIKAYQANPPAGFHGKKTLLLCRNKGRFFEPCPGTQQYICCGYMILTPGAGCPLSCSYCVLQAYLNNPFVTLYANLQDMLEELEAAPELGNGVITRIGTGEFMDSLALDHLTDFSSFILPFFKKRKGLLLELKTKTANIDALARLDHGGAYIVSWSLNTEEIIAHEEQGTAPLAERLAAARSLIDKGYRVGFHFDPLVYYAGWEEGYKNTVRLIAERIPPAAVAWISLGSFRYMPQLKAISLKRFPGTKIFSQEFVPGLDGKMRYLQDMRMELYEKMTLWLRDYSRDVFIYFCMESRAVWRRALGCEPRADRELKKMLDRQIAVV